MFLHFSSLKDFIGGYVPPSTTVPPSLLSEPRKLEKKCDPKLQAIDGVLPCCHPSAKIQWVCKQGVMSLALTIFVLVFLTELISWIGKTVLLNIFYTLHQYLFNSSSIKRQRELKKEILATKQELLQTSAQDQFAKWAKLRRKVDKGLEDLEKLNGELASSKGSYSMKFNTVVWLLTSGAQFAVGWWYGKQAVFYLPPGWFGPITWWLSFPFAPTGSVSCGVWQMACTRVLKVSENIVKDFMGPEKSSATEKAKTEKAEKAG